MTGGITHSGFLSVILDIHNPSPKPFHSQNTIVTLVYSGLIMREVHLKARSVKLPDGRLTTTLPGLPNLYPDAWDSYRFDLKAYQESFKAGERFPVTLRFYTAMGLSISRSPWRQARGSGPTKARMRKAIAENAEISGSL